METLKQNKEMNQSEVKKIERPINVTPQTDFSDKARDLAFFIEREIVFIQKYENRLLWFFYR